MISEYVITKKCTLFEYLSGLHLSIKYIDILVEFKAITDLNGYLNKESILSRESKIYINYSLIEENTAFLYDYPVDILYEDSEIIAVEKPRGILIHSDGVTNFTLLNAVCNYLNNKGDDSCVRCLHRIDYDTTGVVLFSKNILSYSNIVYQIEKLEVKKEYMALVSGIVQKREGEINASIGRDRHNNGKYRVNKNGKSAFTKYSVMEYRGNTTLLNVLITTGRTHQIRVHLAYIGHSIVGDKLYGNPGRLMLHFFKITFKLYNKLIIIKSKKVI